MYTKRGDKGETSLYGSTRVPKDDPRVKAYGSIDELNSLIGVVISGAESQKVADELREVQKLLFVAGGDAACDVGGTQQVARIGAGDTAKLERMTDALLRELPPLSNFILPGGSGTGALLQFARAVCRRAERELLTAERAYEMNEELLPFFNRLSSYLFNLSRWENKRAGKDEAIWKG